VNPYLILGFIGFYFFCLFLIAWITGRNANSSDFFIGSRKSHWYLVALGMIGDSLSGVTFISVPGAVYTGQFSYMQVVLGYFAGYIVINQVLLPLYYRMQLTSIYSYLLNRFGAFSQKTGSFYFLLSRLVGAAARLFLAVSTIQIFVFDPLHIPFEFSVVVMIVLMLLYTFKGGIRTLVWTDSLQSIMLLSGLVFSIVAIAIHSDWGMVDMINEVWNSQFSHVFVWDWKLRNFFWKHFIGGAFIAVAMTGLDQNMMQKNLSCPSLRDAQKNIWSFSVVMLLVNLVFLSLGALLYIFASQKGISLPMNDEKILTDQVFPFLALHHLGWIAGLAFIVGLTAATFSSADSVMTTLTTSFCIDFLNIENRKDWSDIQKIRYRQYIHIAFSVLLLLVILLFKAVNSRAIIDTVLTLSNYTYGPLLGLFAFGLFAKRKVFDPLVPFVCLASPVITWVIDTQAAQWMGGYQFGYELIVVNGLISFFGLFIISFISRKPILADMN